MKISDNQDPVARQYEKWIYPYPVKDLDECIRSNYDLGDPFLFHDAFWPNKDDWHDLDILIAGCGANQAAIYAHKYPQTKVVGIDISLAGLKHHEYLKNKYSLKNLSLHHLAVEDIGRLDSDFDLIISSGVLHHLKDPANGARALKEALRPEGVLSLLLYAQYGRTGVYMLQKLFQEINLKQNVEDLALVKDTLNELAPHHFAKIYVESAGDLDFDAGLVDTFLHKRDRAYTVDDCLDLLEQCDLQFQGWAENSYYYPEGLLPPEHPLYARIAEQGERKIWRMMELLRGSICTHRFFACRIDRPRPTYLIDWTDQDSLNYVPVRHPFLAIGPADEKHKTVETLHRPPNRPYPLNAIQGSLFSYVDGRNDIRTCIEKTGLQGKPETMEHLARIFFRTLWRMGHIFVRLPRQ